MRIWVVTDGRAGNENPALGLAEAIAARLGDTVETDIQTKRIALLPRFDWVPPRIWDLLGARWGGWPFAALTDGGAQLQPPFPDVAIGAGRRSAPIVAALKRVSEGATRAVQILSPQMSLARFDLVAAPAHDRLRGGNVLVTRGALHRITPDVLSVPDPRVDALKTPLAAVMVGGPSRSAAFRLEDLDRMLVALEELARGGWGVGVTASRRTPPDYRGRLAARLADFGGWLWDGDGPNPLFALMGRADALIVTADSVNMASEACATGKPVYVAPITRLAPKLARFHQALADGGHARPMAEFDVGWSPEPLLDVANAAEAVLSMTPAGRDLALGVGQSSPT